MTVSSVTDCNAWLLHALHYDVQLHCVVVFPTCGCKVARLSAAGVGLWQPRLAGRRGGDLVCVWGTGGCGEGQSLCTAWDGVAGVGVTAAGHRSLYSFSHSIAGRSQTWEYGAAARPGKKNKVSMQKCCSWVESARVERCRDGFLLLLSW